MNGLGIRIQDRLPWQVTVYSRVRNHIEKVVKQISAGPPNCIDLYLAVDRVTNLLRISKISQQHLRECFKNFNILKQLNSLS